jgi:hypothetical protein
MLHVVVFDNLYDVTAPSCITSFGCFTVFLENSFNLRSVNFCLRPFSTGASEAKAILRDRRLNMLPKHKATTVQVKMITL